MRFKSKTQTCLFVFFKVYLTAPAMQMQNLKTYSKIGGKITKDVFWFV